jgi:hypothetical protein
LAEFASLKFDFIVLFSSLFFLFFSCMSSPRQSTKT